MASAHPAHPLLQSVLLQQAGGWPGRVRGLARQQHLIGIAGKQGPRRRQAVLAAMQSVRPGGPAGGRAAGYDWDAGGASGGIFGSAELPADAAALPLGGSPANLAASVALPAGGATEPPLDPVSASQLMLQSLYGQRTAEQEQPPLARPHNQQQGQQPPPALVGAPHADQLQHPLQQQQPGAPPPPLQAESGVASPVAASPSVQQRSLAHLQQAPAGSPRQPWLGR